MSRGGLGVLSRPATFVSIAVIGADGAELDDFAEEAIVVDEVQGFEAFRFGDTYFVSPQWRSR